MYRTSTLFALAIAIALAAVGSVANAAEGMEKDAPAMILAKIPLAQAIAIAEQNVKGKALSAEYEHSKKGGVYEVKVISGKKLFEVKLDADKGTVISSKEKKADRDDEEEHEHEHEHEHHHGCDHDHDHDDHDKKE